MSKLEVYFNEYNVPTDDTIYFPYSTGLLRAYAEQFKEVTDNYQFMPFLFLREPVDRILSYYNNPFIACFSSSLWNHRLNLKVAELLKQKFPECFIVFGGPQVTLGKELYDKYPFIDLGVFGEGEKLFKEILLNRLKGHSYERKTLNVEDTTSEIDCFPSPYTKNLFESLISENPDIEFKAIMETNRSCPFKCSFCFFGQSSLNKKITHHSLEYIEAEAQWFADHKIKYIFCADANFGMFKRDITIAHIYSEIKKKNGYPEKFRVCFGKNATDTIFQTAKILSDSNLSKTVTLALQSNDPIVLKKIGRTNIKRETFIALQKKYTEANIPTYTEIILGLPGETLDSFLAGLEFVLRSSYNNQLFIYHCQILPNTEMANTEYLSRHGIKTVRAPLAEVHGSIRDAAIEQEYEELVVSTSTMSSENWQKCAVISWLIQLFYSLKVAEQIIQYLHREYNISYIDYFIFLTNSDLDIVNFFKSHARNVQKGASRCQYDLRFGPIYYEPEELVFLLISPQISIFYKKLFEITLNFLQNKNISVHLDILNNLFVKQAQEFPDISQFPSTEEFAKKVVLHGRKSNFNKPLGFQLI